MNKGERIFVTIMICLSYLAYTVGLVWVISGLDSGGISKGSLAFTGAALGLLVFMGAWAAINNK